MDDYHKYFKDSLSSDGYYDLTSDGRLYKFNFNNSSWDDVSYSLSFDASWIELSHNECYNKLLKVYIDNSIYNLNNHPEFFDEDLIPTRLTKNFIYEASPICVYAIDKRANVFVCTPKGLYPYSFQNGLDQSYLDSIPTYFVMERIQNKSEETILLIELDLYVDKENNVVGIYRKTKEAFIFSRFTSRLDKLYDYKKDNTWKAIKITDLREIFKDNLDQEFSCEISKDNREAQDVLYKFKKNLEKKNNEKYGREFLYYRDFYGVVYAEDEKGNEFIVEQNGFEKVNNAIDKAPFPFCIEPKDVVPSILMHKEHKEMMKKKKNLNANEVLCYEDDDDEIWGKTEDGKVWYFNQDSGEFESIPKKDWPKDLELMDDVQDNVIFQSECRMDYRIEQYTLKYSDGKVSNLYEFFIEEDDNGLKAIYGTDFDRNEYKLTKTSITPVKKGTISSLKQINEHSLFVALEDLDKKN